MSIITLTTDFGAGSHYVAAMKGVILSICPAATIVDVAHDVPPQDIRRAALLLDDAADWFPPETIHVAVVDPGVGTDRAIVYARIGRQQFIAPDNGLLSRLAARTPPQRLIRISDPAYWLEPVSATFHGRDIMAPVAARLALGLDPQRLGPPLDRLAMLDWPAARAAASRIDGAVIEIDAFGNLITNITADMLAGRPDRPPGVRRLQHLRDLGHLPRLRRAAQRNAGGLDRFQRPAGTGVGRRQRRPAAGHRRRLAGDGGVGVKGRGTRLRSGPSSC